MGRLFWPPLAYAQAAEPVAPTESVMGADNSRAVADDESAALPRSTSPSAGQTRKVGDSGW